MISTCRILAVTNKSTYSIPTPRTPACPKCGGTMLGNGFNSVLHCEFYEGDLDIAPDSNPLLCDFEEEAHAG